MKLYSYLIPGLLMVCSLSTTHAQVRAADLTALRQTAAREGWTFSVGKNTATERPLDELCGLMEPADWQRDAQFATPRKLSATLPASFDWRPSGLTPIKNQGNCGSCWAFATVGCLENAIKLKEGITVNLAEQWLVSCNQSGWGCGGGWFAHSYHLRSGGQTDVYGGNGGVLESAFPYTATDASCRGPYTHSYWIDGWAYLAGQSSIPSVSAIKQAIMTYGPISVGVYVSSAFQAYTSGVFNRNEDRTINHAVMLVGWDDNQGANGVWILRNSWGTGWGEDGYMRIEYGCCRVGYAACYVDYRPTTGLQVAPVENLTVRGAVGGPFTPASQTYILLNNSSGPLNWTVSHSQSWLDLSPVSGTLAAGQSINVTASIQSSAEYLANGVYADWMVFSNRTAGVSITRGITLRCGEMDCLTELFDASDNDLANRTFIFTPNGSAGYYDVTCEAASSFPSDPSGGTAVSLPDDGYSPATLGGGATVSLFGLSYGSFYIGANGYLTFGGGDSTWTETLANHFNRPRISALFDDLNPTAGGSVSWRQFSDRMAVSWQNIREYGATSGNNFQIECFFDGVIRITYLGLVARDGLVGLSRGSGTPDDFEESDYSAYPPPPILTGALRVDLEPSEAVTAGAQWRLAGGEWQNSGMIVSDLTAGEFTIEFKAVSGYATPASRMVAVDAGQTTAVSVEYALLLPVTGSVRIDLGPVEAVTAGAQWRVAGGEWQNSGAVVSELTTGDYMIEFNDVAGYTTPASQMVVVDAGQTTAIFVEYALIPPSIGSIRVDLGPVEVVAAGAQWRVVGGDWLNSGTVMSELTAGDYTIEFKEVSDYTKPADRMVSVVAGQTVSVSALYEKAVLSLGEALDQPLWNWSSGGDAVWFAQNEMCQDGADAAESGAIGAYGRSVLESTVTGPGTLNFWWKVSSEPEWDTLSVVVDGVERWGGISGEQEWRQVSIYLPGGVHSLSWIYAKDMVNNRGADCGWVDQVNFQSMPEINLALASRGSTISGDNGAKWNRLIDGSTGYSKNSSYGYTLWEKTTPAPGKMTLDLKTICTINRMRLLLYSLDNRYHRYRIEASENGSTWTTLVDRTRTNCRGWQELNLNAPVEARYLRLIGTYCSIGSYFKVPEWQVYGVVGRYADVRALTEMPPLNDGESELPVVDVITSGGPDDYANGWLAVDGKPETAWIGSPAEEGCWLALVCDGQITAGGIDIDWVDGCSTNVLLLGSPDARRWFDLQEAWSRGPARFQYLWLIFPHTDPALTPSVREIGIRR